MLYDPSHVSHADLDERIARSGFVGRLILNLYRFMREENPHETADSGLKAYWRRQQELRRKLSALGVSRLADLLYTYYIGGSLTRQDQHTFARLHGLNGRAYRLTVVNALAFGLPTAVCYFVLGEGFHLLSSIHSYVELPALAIANTSLLTGLISLCVDLFRAADGLLNKRCWAPFGLLPFVINFPTYLNRIVSKGAPWVRPNPFAVPACRRNQTQKKEKLGVRAH